MRSRELIFILVLSLFCINVFAGSKICLKKEVPVYCEEELEGLNSLNGNIYYKGRYYEFSTRRAFSKKWCRSTQLKIQKILGAGEFCMKFEEKLSEKYLTIESVKGLYSSWSYFK